VSVFRAHHPRETVTLGDFPIREELRRLNSQSVSGQTGQTFDVELSLIADVGNIFCAKNKNVAPMRFHEVVTELVHENLIAGVDRSACDHFTAPVTDSRRDAKVAGQLLGRTIDPVELLVLAFDSREGEEEQKLLSLNLQDLVVHFRNDVDVVSAL